MLFSIGLGLKNADFGALRIASLQSFRVIVGNLRFSKRPIVIFHGKIEEPATR